MKETKSKSNKFQRKNTINGYIMMAPTLIGIAVFIAYPIVCSFMYSFQKINAGGSKWIGFQNYTWMFRDPFFWQSLKNTLFMAVLSVITGVAASFTLASLINSLTYAKKFFKCIFFTPNIVSIVAAATIFKFIFHSGDAGIVNYVLKNVFHMNPVGWFSDPSVSRYSIVILNLWKSLGYDTILFIAGLQSISKELYEAAEVDGATGFQKWRYITIPCMKGITSAIVISYTISSLKRFGDVYTIGGIAGDRKSVV